MTDASSYADDAGVVRRVLAGEVDAFEEIVQRWQGPITSGFGQHLIFVHARTDGVTPPIAEIRDEVRSDWLFERQRQSKKQAYQAIREKYRVLVEGMPYEGDTD